MSSLGFDDRTRSPSPAAAIAATEPGALENREQRRAKPNAQTPLLINLVKRYPDMVDRLAAI